MDKDLYTEYLLRNAFRLEEEFLKKEEERSLCILEFMEKREKINLIKDVSATIEFYNNLDFIKKEALLLRYIKGMLIKEVAETMHYSETRLKKIYRECKDRLKEKLEEARNNGKKNK